jgi:acetyltransferase-like isoleucine patch superfamily enzyme
MNGIAWGNRWRLFGLPIIQKHRGSRIRIGDGLQLRSTVRSAPFGPYHPVMLCTLRADAVIEIGTEFGMNGGSICAMQQVKIGNHVAVGSNSTIVDTEFHPSDPRQRALAPNEGLSSPVVIEDNVFVGANCTILRGVTIGAGSVIGTGSVVTQNVVPGAVVFGNPARVVGRVKG